MKRLLLCTDLDRTLLPNGHATESAGAREIFAHLVSHQAVKLVYVTGRDPGLVNEAIASWGIPEPDLLIADVGTTIADRAGGRWGKWLQWEDVIARDWAGRSTEDLKELLNGLAGFTLQDASRQAAFKLSYFTPAGTAGADIAQEASRRLKAAGVRANVVWSMDDATGMGLLDVLPVSATKRLAIEFVMERWRYRRGEVVFAGDSGNDQDVLVSPIPAVLVANATAELRTSVQGRARAKRLAKNLYCARGGALGMNGNYAAGILEGVLHFQPEWTKWLKEGT
jgi:HAD superfamily hydrolase (TIGR01484 family)